MRYALCTKTFWVLYMSYLTKFLNQPCGIAASNTDNMTLTCIIDFTCINSHLYPRVVPVNNPRTQVPYYLYFIEIERLCNLARALELLSVRIRTQSYPRAHALSSMLSCQYIPHTVTLKSGQGNGRWVRTGTVRRVPGQLSFQTWLLLPESSAKTSRTAVGGFKEEHWLLWTLPYHCRPGNLSPRRL